MGVSTRLSTLERFDVDRASLISLKSRFVIRFACAQKTDGDYSRGRDYTSRGRRFKTQEIIPIFIRCVKYIGRVLPSYPPPSREDVAQPDRPGGERTPLDVGYSSHHHQSYRIDPKPRHTSALNIPFNHLLYYAMLIIAMNFCSGVAPVVVRLIFRPETYTLRTPVNKTRFESGRPHLYNLPDKTNSSKVETSTSPINNLADKGCRTS
ncbi:hypothetical protein RRG08_036122 [Elysia crispata]|uniref:Uncharacterized protein n=1 Tax=Elysia crispata TaxID=231223 RepID=A0AAE1AKW8_9GAST|nr:hypothetical protein RRG08_036122 [Elysia crispata]